MTIIELTTFTLKPDTDASAFSDALAATDRWLAAQPGFLARRYGVGEGGWIDYVEYAGMDAARDIAGRFLSAPEAAAFMAAVDGPTVSMRHFDLRS